MLFACVPLYGAEIVRGPYMDSVRSDAAAIRFTSDVSTVAWINYGPAPNCEVYMTLSEGLRHNVKIYGLPADKDYCYNVYLTVPDSTNTYKAAEGSFKTLSEPTKNRMDFIVFGNSGSGSGEQFELASQMETFTPDFLIHTGNLTATGNLREADDEFFTPYKRMLLHMPLYAALGPNDYGAQQDSVRNALSNYFQVFETPRPRYYFIDTASARFIFLDTSGIDKAKNAPAISAGSTQIEWLNKVLSKTRVPWKFVVLNHPVYSSGPGGDNNAALRRVLVPIFEKYRVQAVFQGFDHAYERTAPIRTDRKVITDGVRYFTFGAGGIPPLSEQLEENALSEKYIPQFSFGHIIVNGRDFSLTVYNKEGEIIDQTDFKR
ncbi:MAG: metallophosphoesterase [Elusimicrobiaceae bacterium]|nr:metallophosphoesterase [Elusimicrobiaceae bacterium]